MEKQTTLITSLFLALIVAVFVVNTTVIKTTTYTATDMFGPLSVYPAIFLIELTLPILFIAIFFFYNKKVLPVCYLIPVLMYVIIMSFTLELSDASYVTSFYDSIGHFGRGLFVSASGHSNPQIDPYFDTQPGFFYFTTIISNVCGLNLSSWSSSASLFILKWTPLFITCACIPILYWFYNKTLKHPLWVSIALTLTFSLTIITFHYSAQAFGVILCWLILSMLFFLVNHKGSRFVVLVMIVVFSLFCVHEGVTILSLLLLIGLIIYPLPFKAIGKDPRFLCKDFLMLPIILGVTWITYLHYLTVNQFSDVFTNITKAFQSFLYEGASIIPSSIIRAYEPWTQVVFFKSVFILILILLALATSFFNAYKTRNECDKLSFGLLVLSVIFFGGAAIGLGGASYIERLPSLMMPIIIYSILKFVSTITLNSTFHLRKRYREFVFGLMLILLAGSVFAGSAVRLSGRNIQSVTYGELYSRSFLQNYGSQNAIGIYNGPKSIYVNVVISADLANSSVNDFQYLYIQNRVLLETYYYTCNDFGIINQSLTNLYGEMQIVYNNPDGSILSKTG